MEQESKDKSGSLRSKPLQRISARLLGPPSSEPSTAGPARAKRCGCLSAASSAPPLDGPRSAGDRCAAPARGRRRVLVTFLFARKKSNAHEPSRSHRHGSERQPCDRHRLNALIASNTHPAIMLVPRSAPSASATATRHRPPGCRKTATRPAAARTAPGARSPLRTRAKRHQHRAMRERIQCRHVQVLLRQRVGHTVRCVGGQADRGRRQQRTKAGQQGRLTCATFQVEHGGSLHSALSGRQMKNAPQ